MSPTDRLRPEGQDALDRIPVTIAGPVALRHLRQGDRGGEVLAAFRQSAYVRLGPDDVLCLCSARLRPGPLNLKVEAPASLFETLRPGMPAVTRSGSLHVNGRHRFDIDGAAEWRPASIPGRDHRCAVERGFAMLDRHIADYDLSEGFAPLLHQLGTDWRNLRAIGHGELDVLRVAVPAISDLLAWLDSPSEAASPPVSGLVGLGPGLTPSGDDLLCGILVTLHSTGRKTLAGRLAEVVMREAPGGTGIISHAHLSCACEGLGSDALHEAINALIACDAAALDRGCALWRKA